DVYKRQGMDSLLSIVQMPKGVPVATFAIGEAGAANAALFAVSLLSVTLDGWFFYTFSSPRDIPQKHG
ncbi:AIR carboxylase family protein, partial [Aeromonas salmonicida]|uniref:AIR carboxylase family protein n=1 Tax=Aeromonas salmonicida TaxID=645 RepID=UPI003D31ED5A